MMTGLSRSVVVIVVVAVMAGTLARAHPPTRKLEALADMIKMEKAMAEERSTHWGVNLTTTEIIEAFGYPTEIHHVTTPDGYILELHRVPHGIAGSSDDRPVALLQHCLLCSSADYVMNTPDQALAYVLADAGYDVWMPNFRGNTYSRAHVELDPEIVDFWRFSWDEMAKYDVPSSIDYILATTGREDLYYVGWSMGTTTFWAMMDERPEYNSKVRAMAGLAPVAYMNYAQGPIIELAPASGDIDTILTLLGVGELFPSGEYMDYLAENFCDSNSTYAETCYNFLFLIAGPDSEELNEEFLPVILAHTPAGASVHTVNHYAQTVMSGNFQKYDYGLIGNMNHYGQSTPPLYNLSAVTAPVGLFWGQTDWLATPEDVARLAAELPNVELNYRIDKDQFNHLDFGWCIHTYEYVNKHVLEFLAAH
ncbi:lipase 3-like [Eriocheir sinensis]|uniref:lipase 3-like n=1 Tax=Eriocheir sinensis TaxID=95602 RepID=UPI0021C8375F|nr:lipase 3-like [Eriocheir sinensis]